MAERLHDLESLLQAAESDRARSLGSLPTDEVLRRTHRALRAARVRRVALTVGGAAASVAVITAGVVAGTPQATVQPAGPEPGTTTSTSVVVPGLPPLRHATEEQVREAPEGSALVLWEQGTEREVRLRRNAPLGGDAYVLMVLPDGEVLQVAQAPQGMTTLTAWDRASATAVMSTAEDSAEQILVDVLTGRIVGTPDEPLEAPDDYRSQFRSPDGTREVVDRRDDAGARIHVLTPDGEVDHTVPDETCRFVAWADDAQLLLACYVGWDADDPATMTPTLALMDATTGAVTHQRRLGVDDGRPVTALRTPDGRVVLAMQLGDVAVNEDADACRTRLVALDTADGPNLAPLAEAPVGQGYDPLVMTPSGHVVLAGKPGCFDSARSGVWSLDLATGSVDVVLPSVDGPDEPVGMIGWALGG